MKNEHDTPESDWMHSVVAAHAADLTRYAASILGDEDLARDAVQDTFVSLWQQPRESIADPVRPWLFRVCRNRAFDLRRKGGRMKPLDTGHATVAEERPGPQQLAETKDRLARVLHLMRALPDNQQEVVRLKFQNGMSYKEIATVTELSVSNVGVLLHTAINTLRSRAAAAGE